MEDFIAVLRAFLLSAHWADDSVAGIQAIEDSIEAFFIKLQTSLVLFYNQLFWGGKRQQKRNRTATKHLRHLLLVSDSAKAHVELLWGCRLGQSLIAELFTLNQVSVLKKVSAINPPFPTAFMQSQGVTVTLSSQQFRSVLSLFLWAPTAPKQCCVALHRA